MKNSCLSVLAVILGMILLSVFILICEVKTISHPEFLKQTLSETQTYSRIPSLVKSDVSSPNFNNNSIISYSAQAISSANWQSLTEKTIDGIFLILNSNPGGESTILDLKPAKSQFIANWQSLAPRIYLEQYLKLPVCPTIASPILNNNNQNITCQSADLSPSQLTTIIRASDPKVVLKTIPDELNLSMIEQNKKFKLVQFVYRAINLLFWVCLGLLLVIGVLIAALNWPNPRTIFRSLGWPLALAAGPMFLIDFLALRSPKILGLVWAQPNSMLGPIFNSLAESINQSIAKSVINISLTFLLMGLILLVASIFMPSLEPNITPPVFKNKSK